MNPRCLEDIGWSEFFQEQLRALELGDIIPRRVVIEYQDRFRLLGLDGHVIAFLTGGLLRDANQDRLDRPAVGDWVATRADEDGTVTIVHLFERRTRFIRQAAGRKLEPQVVAANIDVVCIVTSCNQDFNPRRLERYLTTIENSGARPVIAINKGDLDPEHGAYLEAVAEIAPGVPALVLSAFEEHGLDPLRAHLGGHETVALVGSSGVGKSTLINRLLGEDVQEVRDIRERDGRGRHTTTHRELIVMPGGGVLIDTPGMRELKLWSPGEGLEEAFPDIAELAEGCRFRDCAHGSEPGCAVSAAVARGALAPSRLRNYLDLSRQEQERAARAADPSMRRPPSARRKSGKRRR